MRSRPVAAGAGLALALLLHASAAAAAPLRLTLDSEGAKVSFTLGATLHRVEGELDLASGELRFDPDTGAAAGEIAVDARSARTGLERRDRNMHRDVLESERFPWIVFRAERLRVRSRDAKGGEVELGGVLELHGERRPLVIPARVEVEGARVAIEADFRVPYVDWGIRDYSTFLLRVDRHVDVRVEVSGRIAPQERK